MHGLSVYYNKKKTIIYQYFKKANKQTLFSKGLFVSNRLTAT